MSKIIGIDLGTTNSCVAVMEGGEAVVIPNSEGARTTPSVVAFKDNERLVGQVAKRQAITNPEKTISSIKRHMGTDYKVNIDGKQYTPQEISAMILQKLKTDAEGYLGEKVTEAVITVPAYFTDAQRQATKDAGKIAGLEVKRIINEPTAAALAYGIDKESEQKIMVYDLGGGTFDVSIIEMGDGVQEVLATAGNNHLGGDDFDERLLNYMADDFQKTNGIDLRKDKMAHQRLKEAAEKAKCDLSGMTQTNVNLPFITADATGPKHFDMTITRAKFNELTADLVEATMGPVRNALSDAGLKPSDIGKVLELTKATCKWGGTVPSGRILVDGTGVGDVGSVVLRDRKHLAQDGMLVVVVNISSEDGSVITGPDIITRGFVYVKESENLMEELRVIAAHAIDRCSQNGRSDWSVLKANIKNDLSGYLFKTTKRNPMILPVIMEI